MTLYFSASILAFLEDSIHDDIPADAVALDHARHAQLMQDQARGYTIAANDDGEPISVPPSPPTDDQRRATMRRKRNRLLADSDYTQMPDAPFNASQKAAWRVYRQALRDLPDVFDLETAQWPTPPSANRSSYD
jgi:hypothetical protein